MQDVILNDFDQPIRETLTSQLTEEIADITDEVYWQDITQSTQLYHDAMLSEWIMISNYTAGDFGHRFVWPEM